MKKFIAVLSFIVLTTFAFGQNFEAPKKGAKIYAQEYVINIDQDGEASFDLWIVRSKISKRTKFEAPRLLTSSGLSFNVQQDEENRDHYVVTASASDVNIGQYTITVSSRGVGPHKVTGTTLSFNVNAAKAVASKDGE
ncbi:hypothetical protein [Ekhidna sp.]|uniref:hypothetical protein n=1 Tax=Ekhidna sp. TaxID=2608089 RepID=UPI003CCBB3A4